MTRSPRTFFYECRGSQFCALIFIRPFSHRLFLILIILFLYTFQLSLLLSSLCDVVALAALGRCIIENRGPRCRAELMTSSLRQCLPALLERSSARNYPMQVRHIALLLPPSPSPSLSLSFLFCSFFSLCFFLETSPIQYIPSMLYRPTIDDFYKPHIVFIQYIYIHWYSTLRYTIQTQHKNMLYISVTLMVHVAVQSVAPHQDSGGTVCSRRKYLYNIYTDLRETRRHIMCRIYSIYCAAFVHIIVSTQYASASSLCIC